MREAAEGADETEEADDAEGSEEPRDLGKELLRKSLKAELFGKVQEATRIGRFALIERLAVGGMGEVYSAYDEQLDRKVAIKLVRPDRLEAELAGPDGGGQGGAASVASQRLLREAQTLARLSHPNVVQVYEAGVALDRVFLAMELVRGQTLRHWLAATCDDAEPGRWRAVLQRFLAAGRGLAAAHAAGLVHRDVKPDNILLGDDGRVCVADFGLARAAAGPAEAETALREAIAADDASAPSRARGATDATAATLPAAQSPLFTASGAVLGTPAYMAPEQLQGAAADALSDQFSFCVALYEAVYRALPSVSADLRALHARMTSGVSLEPPRRTPVPAWIWKVLQRGLALPPAERYPSMGELLDALAQHPARRRRRALLAGAALATTAVLAGAHALRTAPAAADPCALAGASVDEIWGPRHAERAAAAFTATGLPYATAAWPPVRERLDDYAASLRRARRAACVATFVRHQQPEQVFTRAALCLDRREQHLGALASQLARPDATTVEHAAAAAAALPALERCRDGEALVLGVEPPPPAAAQDVRQIRGELARARALRLSGHRAQALPLAHAQLGRVEALAYPPLRAEVLAELGRLGRDGGTSAELDEAERRLLDAVYLAEAHRDDAQVNELWIDLTYLARVRGDLPRASEWAQLALATADRLADDGQRSLALSLLGSLKARRGDPSAAEALHRRAIELAGKSGAPPEVLANRWQPLANTLRRLSDRGGEARAAFERAVALQRQALGAGHPYAASLLYDFGLFLGTAGDFAGARERLTAALDLWSTAYGLDSIDAADAHLALGNLELDAGDLEAAERHAAACAEIYRRALPAERSQHVSLASLRGLVAFRRERFPEALAAFADALTRLQRLPAQDSLRIANVKSSLAETLAMLGQHARARVVLAEIEAALTRLTEAGNAPPPVFAAMPLKVRGLIALGRGDGRAAILVLERALALLESQPGYPLEVADVQWALARALRIAGPPFHERAHQLAERARRAYLERGTVGARPAARIAHWLERNAARPAATPLSSPPLVP